MPITQLPWRLPSSCNTSALAGPSRNTLITVSHPLAPSGSALMASAPASSRVWHFSGVRFHTFKLWPCSSSLRPMQPQQASSKQCNAGHGARCDSDVTADAFPAHQAPRGCSSDARLANSSPAFHHSHALASLCCPLCGNPELAASSSLFAAAEAHPNHHWQNRRAALEMPVVRDYPDGYGTAATACAPTSARRSPAVGNLDPQAAQRRCNIGRLIGGLAGGGLGYAASRDDGRAWAIPLGALLGSQVGCPVAQGQGPFGGLGY